MAVYIIVKIISLVQEKVKLNIDGTYVCLKGKRHIANKVPNAPRTISLNRPTAE